MKVRPFLTRPLIYFAYVPVNNYIYYLELLLYFHNNKNMPVIVLNPEAKHSDRVPNVTSGA